MSLCFAMSADGGSHASPMSWLPPELVLCVFDKLGYRDLCVASMVDRYWHDVSNAGMIWKHLYRRDFLMPSAASLPQHPAPFAASPSSSSSNQHHQPLPSAAGDASSMGMPTPLLFTRFEERVRSRILHGFEWRAHYKERLLQAKNCKYDCSRLGPDVVLEQDGQVAVLTQSQQRGQSIVLTNLKLIPGHIYYWEFVVEKGLAGIMLGVATEDTQLNIQLGSASNGWAITGDNGGWTFHEGRWRGFPHFTTGDRVGIRLYLKDEKENEMAVYRNGQFLGVAFGGLSGERASFSYPLYPAVCLWVAGDRVRILPESFVAEKLSFDSEMETA